MLWTRDMLKTAAKQELKQSYWLSFAACIIVTAITSAAVSFASFGGEIFGGLTIYSLRFAGGVGRWGLLSVVVVFLAALIPMAVAILVTSVLEVGQCHFFVSCAYGNRSFNNLFYGFAGGRYWKIVKVMFMKNLFVALWSLLFIIPGIIKHYEYYMVPYIIADDPNLSWREALARSRAMTSGNKGDIFVLELSFIGWELLGMIACCVGVLFVPPYIYATFAQLYKLMREHPNGSPMNMDGYDDQNRVFQQHQGMQ